MESPAEIDVVATYGGLEKQKIREQCWYPLLEARKRTIGGRLKYLTLPARQLTELRALVERGIIEGPGDLVVVESRLIDYYMILRDVALLPFASPVEPVRALWGDINELANGPGLKPFMPVDAINLDYYGFLWGGDKLDSAKWTALRNLVRLQAGTESREAAPFTLLLTVQGRGDGSDHIDDALAEYSEEIGDEWERIKDYPYHGKLLYAIQLMIVHLGFKHHFDVMSRNVYVYQGRSVGGRAKMLSFAFDFDRFPEPPDSASFITRLSEREKERCRQLLEARAVHVVYEVESQEVREMPYDLESV